VALARTAAAYGARVVTRCRAEAADGRGALLHDLHGGGSLEVRARHVVNATGVWADTLDPSVRLRPSKGAHLVVPSAVLGHPRAALSVPVPDEWARFALVLPQPDGYCYVGLTDAPHVGPVPDRAGVTPAERDALLGLLAGTFARPPGPGDVVGAYAGFRPLLEAGGSDGSRTVDLSRRHAVLTGPGGLVTVTGGKLTTYRRMAAEVVDLLTDRPCRTAGLPLVGAGPVDRADAARLPARLVRRFGTEAAAVAALAGGDPGLAGPVAPGLPVLGVEVLWAARHEGALGVDDVLERRTRLGLVRPDADAARPAVTALLEAASRGGDPRDGDLTSSPAPRTDGPASPG
jgi:glycerol-3-phosphate dehydrogenase